MVKNMIYSANKCSIYVLNFPESCEICGKKFKRLSNLCNHGRFDSIFICEICLKDISKRGEIKRLIEVKVSKYENEANEILKMFEKGANIGANIEPCCETINSIEKKIRKLNLPFQYNLESEQYYITIRFEVDSWKDFWEKWNMFNKAQTKCGCAIMYGDGCIADVWGYSKKERKHTKIDFEILSNFTEIFKEG